MNFNRLRNFRWAKTKSNFRKKDETDFDSFLTDILSEHRQRRPEKIFPSKMRKREEKKVARFGRIVVDDFYARAFFKIMHLVVPNGRAHRLESGRHGRRRLSIENARTCGNVSTCARGGSGRLAHIGACDFFSHLTRVRAKMIFRVTWVCSMMAFFLVL